MIKELFHVLKTYLINFQFFKKKEFQNLKTFIVFVFNINILFYFILFVL